MTYCTVLAQPIKKKVEEYKKTASIVPQCTGCGVCSLACPSCNICNTL